MSNNYFQFKQFRIEQDRCAMKVSTDACIQGAWTAVNEDVKRVLDIGTGTGLLSLMLAQVSEQIQIDALEIDEQAASQATENIAASLWQGRINVLAADARSFTPVGKYDLIVCNPPFFQNSLLGSDEGRNTARHTLSLSFGELVMIIKQNLSSNGYASVLLPFTAYSEWNALLTKHKGYVYKCLLVKSREDSRINRVISLCSFNKPHAYSEEKLTIYENSGAYTESFKDLLSPFYLNL